jgi:hypothetical protein
VEDKAMDECAKDVTKKNPEVMSEGQGKDGEKNNDGFQLNLTSK